MPSYKDNNTNKWYCKFYYENLQGEKHQKLKRGFRTKKEADKWEIDFLANASYSSEIDFKTLLNIYLEDYKNRVRETTYTDNLYIINRHILPYFESFEHIKDISPLIIRKWQNDIKSLRIEHNNKPYSNWYLKTINKNINAIFNFAVDFLGLKENPCKKAGPMGKSKSEKELNYWTLEEFNTFIQYVDRKDLFTAYNIFYWTGIRSSELLALTWNDIIINKSTQYIRINKSFQRLNKKDIIAETKTDGSNRTIAITDKLLKIILDYKKLIYKPADDERIFQCTQRVFSDNIKKYIELSGVKKIVVHDLRHSHASLLINNGANILLVSKRLGHDNIETTLNIYSHLFPKSENEIIDKLELLE